MATRRMSAKQRRYFGPRQSTRRSVTRSGHRAKKKMTLSLAVIAGLAPTPIMAYQGFLNAKSLGTAGAISDTLQNVVMRWTGFQPQYGTWDFSQLKYNLAPAVMGLLIHKAAGKLGLNRMIASSGIPLFRI